MTVVKDTTKPTVVGPAETFYGQTVANTTSRAKISWSGSDAGTGIEKFELEVSVNGGAFTNLTLSSAAATSINRTLTDKKSYRYRVRATDNEGNVGAWVYGPAFKPGPLQNNSASVVYVGPWTTARRPRALGGSHRYASSCAPAPRSPGRPATSPWSPPRPPPAARPRSGSTASWRRPSTCTRRRPVYRKLVFSKHFARSATHTIEVRPLGGTRVYLDAFLVLR